MGEGARALHVLYTGAARVGVTTSLMHVAHARSIVPDPHPRLGFELATRGGERLDVHSDVRSDSDAYASLEKLGAPDAMRRMRQWLEPRLAAHVAFLRKVDGIVFVVDSRVERVADNRERLDGLVAELARVGRSPNGVPIVFQCNKRDLDGALPMETLERLFLWPRSTHVATIASKGERVFDALRALVGMMVGAETARSSAPPPSAEGLLFGKTP